MEGLQKINERNEEVVRNAQALEIINYLRDKGVKFIELNYSKTPSITESFESTAPGMLPIEDIKTQEKLAEFLSEINAIVTHNKEENGSLPKVGYNSSSGFVEVSI